MIYGKTLYRQKLYQRTALQGYRLYPIIVPLNKGMAVTATPEWTADTPPNTQVYFEISADYGTTWRRIQNGNSSGLLPIIMTENGTHEIWLKLILETCYKSRIPSVSRLAVSINQYPTLYSLALNLFTDAGIPDTEFWIDPELLSFPVPYAWLQGNDHRQALEQIVQTCLGECYVDRYGRIHLEGPSFIRQLTALPPITPDNYFSKSLSSTTRHQANFIEVYSNPLVPTTEPEVVYRSSEPIAIRAGETKTITAFFTSFYTENPVVDCTPTLENAPTGAAVTHQIFYSWGGVITISSPISGTFSLVIKGRPLKVKGRTRAIAQDEASIESEGLYSYKHPAKKLIQTPDLAQKIADTLLAKFNKAPQTLTLTYTGNPALELNDSLPVSGLHSITTTDYLITSHELTYDGGLQGKLEGIRPTS